MDFKVKIIQALDELDKLTGESSTKHLRETLSGESDDSKLFLKYQALREILAESRGENEDVSFKVGTPNGTHKEFKNLEAFLSDTVFREDLKEQIRVLNKQ